MPPYIFYGLSFITEDSVEGNITNPLSLNLYTYCWNDPISFKDPSGHLRESYTDDKGVYHADPDAEEFGKDSDTYKICLAAGKRWAAAKAGSEIRKDMASIANNARTLARAGTPLVYAQDKIANELSKNRNIVKDIVQTYNEVEPNSIAASIGKAGWFASMVGEHGPWDYKNVSSWKLPYDNFDGQNTTGANAWRKGTIQYMYYDGMLISAAEFGNINYGYTGKAVGFSDNTLYTAGGGVHQLTAPGRGEGIQLDYWPTYFDAPDDHEFVKYGINKYRSRR